MKPRVAVLFEYPTLLGGERSLLVAAEHLQDQFDFLAIAPPRGPLAAAVSAAGIPIVASPLFDGSGHRLSRPDALDCLTNLAAELDVDLLHGNSLAMGRLTGAVADRLNVPSTAHLRDIVRLSQAAVGNLNENAALMAVSAATRQYHVQQGVAAERCVVVHNGVDLVQFRPQVRNTVLRREWAVPDDAVLAVGVGQIGLRKGWDVLAAAAEHLTFLPNLHLVIAGERHSIKQESRDFEAEVRRRLAHALPGRVRFVGYRSDIPALLAAADLLVHPARQEPFGRVLLEAAAAGKAIVATNVGGTAELLDDETSALLVPSGDATLLADALSRLINDAALRDQLGAAARLRVERDFGAALSAARLAEVWHLALGG